MHGIKFRDRGDVLDTPNTLRPEQELVALKKENA